MIRVTIAFTTQRSRREAGACLNCSSPTIPTTIRLGRLSVYSSLRDLMTECTWLATTSSTTRYDQSCTSMARDIPSHPTFRIYFIYPGAGTRGGWTDGSNCRG